MGMESHGDDGDNALLVHQSSLAVLPAETSGAGRRNGRRSENFAYQYLKYLKGSVTCRKILRHGTFPLYFPSERKVCCGYLSPLKSIASVGFEPAILGSNGKHTNHYTNKEY
jgi:hypothetical protein